MDNDLQLAVKEHFRLLVLANKGPTAAAAVIGCQQSHISEAMSKHVGDRMPRADHVAILEAACGQPIVTAFLASLHGMDLVPRADGLPAAALHQHMARLTKEHADVMGEIAKAIDDGVATDAERKQICQQLEEQVRACHAAIADLRPSSRRPS